MIVGERRTGQRENNKKTKISCGLSSAAPLATVPLNWSFLPLTGSPLAYNHWSTLILSPTPQNWGQWTSAPLNLGFGSAASSDLW
ncbi:hypothetical protein BpHYR1_031956 [Brachionus plicatilis]|uniref:Uncharacterized protein n=1 Tax=Brachionus plicatilis TaxID=10195 RepID=A0A3M7S461_BRAPC|nr:hypothetical protein BpHYR1_031956 [Brachionus plicatilis]